MIPYAFPWMSSALMSGPVFQVIIMCDTQCYKVMVNGALMFSYNHRHFLLQEIDILEVEGDVSLSSVLV